MSKRGGKKLSKLAFIVNLATAKETKQLFKIWP
jgi:hypothetical protein